MRLLGLIFGETERESLRRQPGPDSCYNEKRWNVSAQVAEVVSVGNRLHSHGGSVNDAGPDGEGDEDHMPHWIA